MLCHPNARLINHPALSFPAARGWSLQDPWFGVELPPGALAMNDHYLTLEPACEQTEEEIKAVVAAVNDEPR